MQVTAWLLQPETGGVVATWAQSAQMQPGVHGMVLEAEVLQQPQLWWPLGLGPQVRPLPAGSSSVGRPAEVRASGAAACRASLGVGADRSSCVRRGSVTCSPAPACLAGGTQAVCAVQALYTLQVDVEVLGLGCSDHRSVRLGLRTVHSVVDQALKGHVFHVNRQRVRSSGRLLAVHAPGLVSHRAGPAEARTCNLWQV